MSRLEELRNEILRLDEEILSLVHRRVEAAQQIGAIKDAKGLPLQNFAVEKNVLEHALETAARLGVGADTTRRIVEALVRAALHVQERDRVRRRGADGRNALIVGGSGLMGSWFGRFLQEKGFTVHALDPASGPWPPGDPEATPYDVVVVATPPSAVPNALQELAPRVAPDTLVFDIASIKGRARQVLEALARDGRRVASLHPMFGPSTELLMGHNVLVVDCGPKAAADAARQLFADTTASVHTVPLGQHDKIMADVLGLAHAVSLVFNQALSDGPFAWKDLAPYASTTFRKQAAISREVAQENPRLYFEIQTLNPHNEAMLDRLAASVASLRAVVSDRDEAAFGAMMDRARSYYEKEADA